MASSMAFFWAEEPSPFRVPEKQSAAAAELPPVAAAPPEPPAPPELLSQPQADRARAPVRATAPAVRTRLVRMSCTGVPLSVGGSWSAGDEPALPSGASDSDARWPG